MRFVNHEELMEIIGIKKPYTAKRLIAEANRELENQGYLIIKGRVPLDYMIKRLGIEAK
jgi:hypothetical protein